MVVSRKRMFNSQENPSMSKIYTNSRCPQDLLIYDQAVKSLAESPSAAGKLSTSRLHTQSASPSVPLYDPQRIPQPMRNRSVKQRGLTLGLPPGASP